MYCLNIHPGEHWDENLFAIQHYACEVKEKFSPNEPFALGLRLSAIAAHELLPQIEKFSAFLCNHNLYVVTINGFPYGRFHGTSIKKNVYLPDWSSSERVSYTLHLAKILAILLPEGETGTISTVPVYYGKDENPSAITNLIYVAAALNDIKIKTGKHIILALEPEPDCYLDTINSTLDFFTKIRNSAISASDHLGVCLDTCHTIVEFESPFLCLQRLTQEGIQVPKIQISAALTTMTTTPQEAKAIFMPYIDWEYVHQTRICDKDTILRFNDLENALEKAPCGEWRVHFHVPLTWAGEKLSSTAKLIEDDFFLETYRQGKKHLEVETYSYNLLPYRKPPIIDSIVSELEWVKERFDNTEDQWEHLKNQCENL